MDSLKEKENNSIADWMANGGTCLAVKPIRMYGWLETGNDSEKLWILELEL